MVFLSVSLLGRSLFLSYCQVHLFYFLFYFGHITEGSFQSLHTTPLPHEDDITSTDQMSEYLSDWL